MHSQNEKAMPSTSRPRGFTGAASGSGGGRSAPNTPMSERQQMALLMQMTSSSNQAGELCGVVCSTQPVRYCCLFLFMYLYY